MVRKIAILGVLFEISQALRILLILKQKEWKNEDLVSFNIVFTAYIIIGEVGGFVVLISGMFFYTRKLQIRNKQ